MIEILKHGMITGAKRRFSINCPFCLCKFNFEEEDITAKEKRLGGCSYIACPDCKKIIKFFEDEQQIGVKYTIKNNENI